MVKTTQAERIKTFLIFNAEENPTTLVRKAAHAFGVSRQAIAKHINKLVADGVLIASGERRGRRYKLEVEKHESAIAIADDTEENEVWKTVAAPYLEGLPRNVSEICHYGFTEMVNNAIDHSAGQRLKVRIERSAGSVTLHVNDDGVGIFKKICQSLGLTDERQAILELAKGKLTTDPERHSGEGIFFTSRMFDQYSIYSGDIFFYHSLSGTDWITGESGKPCLGTFVKMAISNVTRRTMQDIFDQFSAPTDFGFTKTHVPVFLAKYGDEFLVSRSQAKRLLTRVNRFEEVVLDFDNVNSIGQAFADEIFRVFVQANPKVNLSTINTNEAVSRMIARARSQPLVVGSPESRS
jgi:transposase